MRQFKLADQLSIEDRTIGKNEPAFIIAEVGVNHNGDLDLAHKHIEAVAECKADAVKFQTFRTEEFLASKDQIYEYESAGKKCQETMYEMFKRLELPMRWHQELFDHARKIGLVPLTSVADIQSAEMVNSVGIGAYKASSEDLVNLPLIKHLAQQKLPIIFSTGMANCDEIIDVLSILEKHNHTNCCFLHCTSQYPTPIANVNLSRMQKLTELGVGLVGYSDHTVGNQASLAAVAMGAKVIEKHFTLDQNLPGPDHTFSSPPEELTSLVAEIRNLEKMLGSGQVDAAGDEYEARLAFHRSLVAARDLPQGHVLTKDDIVLKRPGTGLRYRDIDIVLGKALICNVKADHQILETSI